MGNTYHSDAHLPLWKRLLIWCTESDLGKAAIGIVAALTTFGPIYLFGWWWALVAIAWGVGFAMGHAVARSEARQYGEPPKL